MGQLGSLCRDLTKLPSQTGERSSSGLPTVVGRIPVLVVEGLRSVFLLVASQGPLQCLEADHGSLPHGPLRRPSTAWQLTSSRPAREHLLLVCYDRVLDNATERRRPVAVPSSVG